MRLNNHRTLGYIPCPSISALYGIYEIKTNCALKYISIALIFVIRSTPYVPYIKRIHIP